MQTKNWPKLNITNKKNNEPLENHERNGYVKTIDIFDDMNKCFELK